MEREDGFYWARDSMSADWFIVKFDSRYGLFYISGYEEGSPESDFMEVEKTTIRHEIK